MRGRILQRPVEPGAARAQATLRRWGPARKFEARAERIYGAACLESMLGCSPFGFTPIAGFPAYIHNGYVVPRLAGGAGFSGVDDMRVEALGGKGQRFRVDKNGQAAGVAQSRTVWAKPTLPVAGGVAATVGAAAGTGTAFTNLSTGSLQQRDAWAGEQLYFVGAKPMHTLSCGCLVLYDHYWSFVRDMTVSGTSTVTAGALPARAGADKMGNWLGGRASVGFGATAQTWTVQWHDAGGTGRTTSPAVNASAAANDPALTPAVGFGGNSFFIDFGTNGLTDIISFALNTGNTAGAADWVLGHNLVCLPCPSAGTQIPTMIDGWLSAFNLAPIPAGAAVAVMEHFKSASSAGVLNIEDLLLVSG